MSLDPASGPTSRRRALRPAQNAWGICVLAISALLPVSGSWAQGQNFTIGAARKAPPPTLTCAAPRDDISRKALADLDRGVRPPNVPTADLARALLELRIGFAEADASYLSRAVERFRRNPHDASMRRAALVASMQLAVLQRDLEAHSAARDHLEQALQSSLKPGSAIQLYERLGLLDAAREGADGLGGDQGRALLRRTIAESAELLLAARSAELGEDLQRFERFHRLLQGQLGWIHRDSASVKVQLEAQRAATPVSRSPAARIADAEALNKLRYDLAALVRGEEGLRLIAELRQSLDLQVDINAASLTPAVQLRESAYRGLETVQGHWQVFPVDGERICLERVRIKRQRAMADILEQSLRADTGRPSATALQQAIDALLEVQIELSRQPDASQPNSLELVLGRGYRLQASHSENDGEKARLMDRAAMQFDASRKRLDRCFCGWRDEELSRERAALDSLRSAH